MITSSLTLSHAEARANELRQRAESRTTTDGRTSARSKHAPRRMRSAAIALVGIALVAAGLAGPAGAVSPSFDPPHGRLIAAE
jgi:uncharacterized membrane protein YjgN (DUF898 family)